MDSKDTYSRKEVREMLKNFEEKAEDEDIKKKIPYWKAAGAILGPEMQDRWNDFVDSSTSKTSFYRGIYIDETLMVLAMLKTHVSVKEIVKVLKCFEFPNRILSDISTFTGKEIADKLSECLQSDDVDSPV